MIMSDPDDLETLKDYFKTPCPKCEESLIHLSSGGCGGYGSHLGCEKCDIVWQQVTGGILSTGEDEYHNSGWGSIEEFKERLQLIKTQKEEWKRLEKLSEENKKYALRLFNQCLSEIHSLGFEMWAYNEYIHRSPMTVKSVVLKERKNK